MFDYAELGQKLEKDVYNERVPKLRMALLDAQYRAQEAAFSVVIVISGVEGAGKGDAINVLLEWMDARGMEVHALGLPTPEETERPFFFRFWRRLPPVGQIAIFFGSWYTAPIVEHALGECDDQRFEASLDRIVEFERMLVDENVLLLKFWLHISKKEQRKRFKKLDSDPDTSWRVNERDWEFHEIYEKLAQASARALSRTDSPHAQWDVIESHDKRFRNASIGEAVVEALEKRLDQPAPPPVEPEPLPVPREVNLINSLDLSLSLERKTYEDELDHYQGRLGRLSRRMLGAGVSAVLVFEGSDAAGKGGCIRRLVHALDARFYRVIPIAAPTDEEKARPYLWRFWRNLPRHGHFAIFDRSWYGRVLVERIEGFASPTDWHRAFTEIRSFEDQLVDAGVVLVKFWLSTSPEEQLRRFEERKATGYKRYKITEEDWRNREKWGAYEAAANEMIARTGTGHRPWTLVEAEDKLFARIKVLRTVCERLEQAVGEPESVKDSGKGNKKRAKK